MIIQYCSDLHLEFPENDNYVTKNLIKPVGDILILAGDLVTFSTMSKRQHFFDYIADNFEVTYWIPGNHEYYGSDISERSGTFQEKIRDNIFLVNNNDFVYGNTRFIFSTLWSAISEMNKINVENAISDFKAIRFHRRPYTSEIFNDMHHSSLNYITNELKKETNNKTVVVTHHVPTFLNYPKKYKGDSLNEVFAVELSDLIELTNPDYWIYGHHHTNTEPFSIGSTKLITNQLGYVHHYEHGSFSNSRHIIV